MYRSIHCKFWTDPDIVKLTKDEKLLALYLMTNPHSHLSGLYYITVNMMADETGIDRRGIEGGLDGLQRGYKAIYEPEFRQILVVNMFSYQGRGQNLDKGVASYLATLHKSHLITRFLERYPSVKKYLKSDPIDTPSLPPSEGVGDFPSPVPVPDSSLNSSSPEKRESEGVTKIVTTRSIQDADKLVMVVERWNQLVGVVKVQKVGEHLKRRIRVRIDEHPDPEWWLTLYQKVAASDFLCGRKTDFAASLDWVLGPKNLEKIQAGNFDNRTTVPKTMADLLAN